MCLFSKTILILNILHFPHTTCTFSHLISDYETVNYFTTLLPESQNYPGGWGQVLDLDSKTVGWWTVKNNYTVVHPESWFA